MVSERHLRNDLDGTGSDAAAGLRSASGEALSELVAAFALAAVVLAVSALFPTIFLGLGLLIGVRRSLAYLLCTVYHSPCCHSLDAFLGGLQHLNLIAHPDRAAFDHPRTDATTTS